MTDITFNSIQDEFLQVFEANWQFAMQELGCKQRQFLIGSRLRPQITLWGYLATVNIKTKINFDLIAKTAISIEMIHKSSLLIDDWIDNDDARHGEKTFHVEYGPQYSVVMAIHMVSEAMRRLSVVLPQNVVAPTCHYLCVDVIANTVHAMSAGLLREMNLMEKDFFDYEKITEIAHLETAVILSNGMLLGYYIGGGTDDAVCSIFKTIGELCGFLFQTMNDLEAYANSIENEQHKGKVNYDIDKMRKNIVIARLYQVASLKDKKYLETATGDETMLLAKKYNISKIILQEMELVYKQLLSCAVNLHTIGVPPEWSLGFQMFLRKLKHVAESRLGKQG